MHESQFEVEPENSKAKSVKVGQAVSWSINKDPDPPSTVHGIVVSVSKENATMNVWAIMDDGSHKKTDRNVTQPISKLKVIADFRGDSKAPEQTNFPNAGDNQKISLSNSDFRQFPDYAYVKKSKRKLSKDMEKSRNRWKPSYFFY